MNVKHSRAHLNGFHHSHFMRTFELVAPKLLWALFRETVALLSTALSRGCEIAQLPMAISKNAHLMPTVCRQYRGIRMFGQYIKTRIIRTITIELESKKPPSAVWSS